jgi:hypothetical protein
MNKRALAWLAVLLLVLLAACGPAATEEPDVDPVEEPPEELPTDAPVQQNLPDLTETALWQMVEASETAGAIQTATATALAAAQTATERALADAADTQVAEFAGATETAAAAQTAEARLTLIIEDPANDGLDCQSGEAVTAMEPQDDLRALRLATDRENLVVTAGYAAPDAQAAMRAASLLYGLTVGVSDPDKDLPAENPASPYAAAANLYFQAAWFLPAALQQTYSTVFEQGQWVTINPLEGVSTTVGAEVQAFIPLSYFPAQGLMLVGVSRDNRVCDYAGLTLATPYKPLIRFEIVDGVMNFDLEQE